MAVLRNIATNCYESGRVFSNAHSPRQIVGCRSWYDPTRVTLTSGRVSTWPDQGPYAKNVTQGTAGNRPTPGASPTRLDYDNANPDYIAASTAADHKYLHDGTGCTIVARHKVTDTADTYHALVDTGNWSGANSGVTVAHDCSNGSLWFSILVAGTGLDINSAAATCPNSAWNTSICTFKDGASPEAEMFINGTSRGTGSVTPSSANPAGALTIGARIGAGNALGGQLGDIATFTRVLDANERARMTWFVSRTA